MGRRADCRRRNPERTVAHDLDQPNVDTIAAPGDRATAQGACHMEAFGSRLKRLRTLPQRLGMNASWCGGTLTASAITEPAGPSIRNGRSTSTSSTLCSCFPAWSGWSTGAARGGTPMRRYNHCSPVSARVNLRMIVQLLHRTGQRGCLH
jgi:hypothetical protein